MQKSCVTVWHYVVQGFTAILFMFLVLHALDKVPTPTVIWAAGASSLASSTYIVFCIPHRTTARPYQILVGYIIAIVCGEVMRMVAHIACDIFVSCYLEGSHFYIFEIAAAISVGLALFLMLLMRSQHAPAAGLAVVMVLDIGNYYALGVILIAALILVFIRWVFSKWLCDLC